MTDCRAVGRRDVALLQALLDASSDYTRDAFGRQPEPGDGLALLVDRPEGVDSANKVGLGAWRSDELAAFADLLRGYPTPDVAYIGLLIVHPESRGRGVGRALHEAILSQVRAWPEIRRLQLGVVQTNAATASPFWSALGYRRSAQSRPFRRDDGVVTTVSTWERAVGPEG